MTQYQYVCSNPRCGLIMSYATAQTKDVNCPACTHKSAISNRNVLVIEVLPPANTEQTDFPSIGTRFIAESERKDSIGE
jgi:DNA-directed RNA polymerase subunit RPC12/RpoP